MLFVSPTAALWRTAAATWLSADTQARLLRVMLVRVSVWLSWAQQSALGLPASSALRYHCSA